MDFGGMSFGLGTLKNSKNTKGIKNVFGLAFRPSIELMFWDFSHNGLNKANSIL